MTDLHQHHPRNDDPLPGLVDWDRTARRVAIGLALFQGIAVLAWLGTGLAGAGFGVGRLAGHVGLALLASFAVEFVVVGGSAARGMLRAGARGERLASDGVGLLPARRSGSTAPVTTASTGPTEASDPTGPTSTTR